MDSLLCGWASEGVGEAVGRPVDPCWDDEGNDVDAGPQRVEPDEAPTVVVEESDVAALAEEMRKLSEDAIAMKEQMRLLELERLEAHLEAERAAREDAAAMDEDEPAAPATVADALAPPAPENDEAADARPAAYAPAEYSPTAAEPRPADDSAPPPAADYSTPAAYAPPPADFTPAAAKTVPAAYTPAAATPFPPRATTSPPRPRSSSPERVPFAGIRLG